MYEIIFSDTFLSHLDFFKSSGQKQLAKKIDRFLDELMEHPATGTGKPERLRHVVPAVRYSRRISDEHRLVYDIDETTKTVAIIAAKGHYE